MAEVDSMTGRDASGTTREFPTLKPLIERVGALTAPEAGSVNAQLAALLAKLIDAPATAAKQDDAITALGAIVTALGTIDSRVDGLESALAVVATSAKQDAAAAILALIGTRKYGTTERIAIGAASTSSAALAATEVMIHADVRCFAKEVTGAGVVTTTDGIPIEAGEKFHMRITSGNKVAVIQATLATGFCYVTLVVA